jgi:gamma-glutamyltranspeptidase/glutathione hydrolase
MVFGTPGGDQQDQWTLQFFLNFVDFGMGLQEAIDAANFHTEHFPSSFYPRKAKPGSVVVESRIPETTRKELEARGHKVTATGPWSNGLVMAAHLGPRPGVLSAGVSPRGMIGYVTGD